MYTLIGQVEIYSGLIKECGGAHSSNTGDCGELGGGELGGSVLLNQLLSDFGRLKNFNFMSAHERSKTENYFYEKSLFTSFN